MTNSADNLCQFLQWDTEFFGHRIARVIPNILTPEDASKIDTWCAENEIDCLYFLATSNHADSLRVAEDNGYHHVDIRHLYELDLSKSFAPASLIDELTLDVATPDDVQSMIPMIDHAFDQTRFYYDPHFNSEQANKLYKTWLIQSVKDDFADAVLLIRKDNIPWGFITCSLDKNTKIGSIGLIGVADFARGQNLGVNLVLSSLSYFKQHQMEKVQVVTQGRNIGANRLYQKCGFRTLSVHLWYHKWFKK